MRKLKLKEVRRIIHATNKWQSPDPTQVLQLSSSSEAKTWALFQTKVYSTLVYLLLPHSLCSPFHKTTSIYFLKWTGK